MRVIVRSTWLLLDKFVWNNIPSCQIDLLGFWVPTIFVTYPIIGFYQVYLGFARMQMCSHAHVPACLMHTWRLSPLCYHYYYHHCYYYPFVNRFLPQGSSSVSCNESGFHAKKEHNHYTQGL